MFRLRARLLDQQLMTAIEPGGIGVSRWNRVQAMVSDGPADPAREYIESLTEHFCECSVSDYKFDINWYQSAAVP